MKKNSIFVAIVFTILFLLTSAKQTLADYGQYGGNPPSQSILIEKMVGIAKLTKGGTVEYVNNLSPSDPRFSPGQQVAFKLKIKNTSTVKLTNVVVKDFVPNNIEPMTGPGTYDTNTRTITFNAGDLDPDQEKIFYLTMQVNAQNKLPANLGLFCVVNKAQVTGDNNIFDDSSSQLCIEKQVNNVTTTPKAGPTSIILFGQFAILGLGIALKKRFS